jgi:hypothetical protein
MIPITKQNIEIAPVVLFVFNRPQLATQTFGRIRQARPSRLFVVADGPRVGHPDDLELCRTTRSIVSSADWKCELQTNFAEENLGNGQRMSSGLDWVFKQCEEAIVLEDDCVPSRSFFNFCTTLLTYYRHDERVMHISGDNYQDGIRRGLGSYFFSRYSLSWGWASWARAWQHYDFKIRAWPAAREEKWLNSFLDDRLEIKYWTTIFDRLYRGLIDTWDYQWLFTCWRHNGLSVQPNVNLVSNVGAGADATNFKEKHSTMEIPTGEISELLHPGRVERDKKADQYTFLKHIAPPRAPLLQSVRDRIALRTRIKSVLSRAHAVS